MQLYCMFTVFWFNRIIVLAKLFVEQILLSCYPVVNTFLSNEYLLESYLNRARFRDS